MSAIIEALNNHIYPILSPLGTKGRQFQTKDTSSNNNSSIRAEMIINPCNNNIVSEQQLHINNNKK